MDNFFEKIENYALDVSKYVLTGFVLTSFLHNFEDDSIWLIAGGVFLSFLFAFVAYIIHININKDSEKKNK